MMQQRLLKMEEHPGSEHFDDRVNELTGTDIAEHVESGVPEVVVSVQSVSVVAYNDRLHAYILVTTQNSL